MDHPKVSRRRGLGRAYVVVLWAALVLYGVSVAPGVLWGDSGAAQVRVLQRDLQGRLGLALSHPLYYMLAIAFQALPAAGSALKTNLVSAVCGAVTVANVYLLLGLLTRRRAAAVVGTISLAVAHTFWQHCALAEVYTVSTALLTTELLCLVQYMQRGQRRWLLLMMAANGLGVSNHMLAVLNVPVWGVLLIWLLYRRRIGWVTILGAGAAWLAGASLYIGMIVAELVAGGSFADVMSSALFGRVFASNVLNVRITPGLLGRSLLYLGLNFPTPVALLALLGLAHVRRGPWRPAAGWIAALLVIHLVWAVRYNPPDQYTFFIPAIVLAAVFIGLGAERALERWARMKPAVLVVLALLPVAVYVPLPWLARAVDIPLGVRREVPYRTGYTYFLWPWKTGYQGALRFATEARDMLPEGAVLIADSTTVAPIHYLIALGAWRGPVDVWPVYGASDATYWPGREDVAAVLEAQRLYVVTPQAGYCPPWLAGYGFEREGVLYRVLPPATDLAGGQD